MKIILGTVQFGKNYGISNYKGRTRNDEINKILQLAYKNKINTLDTAFCYGVSEKIIGQYIYDNPDQSWEIISKGSSLKNFYKSLELLGNSLTTYLAHDVNEFLSDKELQNNLYGLKENSLVKKIGVSVYNADEIVEVLNNCDVDIIQLPINILDHRLIKSGLLKKVKDMGVEVHARSIFLQGLLFLSKKKLIEMFPDVIQSINKIKEIAEANSLKISDLALLFVNDNIHIDKLVIGVNNIEQLKNNIKALKISFNKDISNQILNNIDYMNEKTLNPTLWDK